MIDIAKILGEADFQITKQLKKIGERGKALGWVMDKRDVKNDKGWLIGWMFAFTFEDGRFIAGFAVDDKSLEAAERLLSLYEGGPVKDIIIELERRIRERFRAEPDFPIKQIRAKYAVERGSLMAYREIIEYLKSISVEVDDGNI